VIRHWTRARFIAFSAVVGVVAFFLAVWSTDLARRRTNARETRRELVLAATSVRGAIAVYDPRADRGLVALDAYVERLRREQLYVMLGIGAVAVVWAGVARAWLAGRRRRHPLTPDSVP
jgi:ABC-type transporter Mla subunit MlaD